MESMDKQNKSSILIMVAVDESKNSMYALQWALNKLITSQDRIILIHAQRTPTSYMTTGSTGFMLPVSMRITLENDIKKSTEKIFARAMELCKVKNVIPKTEVHTGDAREVIYDAAKKHNPDMLVLGSHGYGAFKRMVHMVLGSVSDYCVHHVQCPVLVVKPQENNAH